MSVPWATILIAGIPALVLIGGFIKVLVQLTRLETRQEERLKALQDSTANLDERITQTTDNLDKHMSQMETRLREDLKELRALLGGKR